MQFIDAAVRVIAERGVGSATTRRIAEAADAPLASLHYCFRDKDGLFLAVFEYLAAEITKQFTSIEPDELEATAVEVVRRSVRWLMEHPDYALAEVDLYMWMTRNRPALAKEAYDVFLRAVTDVLQRAAGPGARAEAIENLGAVLIGATDGLVLQWASDRDRARADAFADVLCAGIPAMCSGIRK
ncbi:TetR/AcrR family transcriptional regulator [Nocardia mikamii]|uniref:TetR/AcrR family transcriptional regulator n=1 Tax=Nocardia mikamii TaxID=508464 RepID=UPI0007A50078|nr:TetR/AcrR family transcriptional regulator [Nocardia mikamii]